MPAAMEASPTDGGWRASLRSDTGSSTFAFDTVDQVSKWIAANTAGHELGDNIGTITWMTHDLSRTITINAGNLWSDNAVRLTGVKDKKATDALKQLVQAWIAEWGYATSGPTFTGPSGLTFGESTWVRSWRLRQTPQVQGVHQSEHALGILWTVPPSGLFRKSNPTEVIPTLGSSVDELDVLIPFWPRAWPQRERLAWYAQSAAYPERRMKWENGRVDFHGVTTENGRSIALMSLAEQWSWFHYDVGYEAWNAHFLEAARVHDAVIAQKDMGVRWVFAAEEVARATAVLLRNAGSKVEVTYMLPDFN
ncbi:MAG TPA: hypothetical protein GXZ30_06760 [Propionibacterium sp.]|nr:hypothetical protein [Propionibacterium sp.]